MMVADPLQIKKRFEALKAKRASYDSHCEEVAALVLPNYQGFVGQRTANEKRLAKVYDGTGIHANEMLAAGLHGLMSNPASKWFNIGMATPGFDDNDAVRDWLSDTADVMRTYMYAPGTNLTTALHECYLQLGAFGSSVMFIGERDRGGLLFQARPRHECYIAEDHEETVDTVYRISTMTARQIMMQWPDTCPAEIRQKVESENKPDDSYDIVHAVEPRKLREVGKRDAKNMVWQSCYVCLKTNTLLEESGYTDFPYAVARWSKLPAEVDGRSPAMTALPDIKMLQEMTTTTIKAAQRAVDPPLTIPDDGVVGPVRNIPGGFIYYRGEQRPEPMVMGGNIPLSLELEDAVRNRIRQMFFADLLQFPTDTDFTATEFVQRMQMRMQLLGPVMGRLEGELLARIVRRTYAILFRLNALPPMPPEIAQGEYTVEFVSPIALAQKQGEANAVSQTVQVLLPFIEATKDATALRVFKLDDMAKKLFEIFGGDPDLVYTRDELQAMDERAQQQQAAMMAQPMADAMNKGASAVDKLASAQEKGANVAQLFG